VPTRADTSFPIPELAEWVAAQHVDERGDKAVSQLRSRGLVG
jgi:hypothetical protein